MLSNHMTIDLYIRFCLHRIGQFSFVTEDLLYSVVRKVRLVQVKEVVWAYLTK